VPQVVERLPNNPQQERREAGRKREGGSEERERGGEEGQRGEEREGES
jgi:hypothetical protein